MQDWIVGVIATYGYLGIFLMIGLENIFPPIPSEVILTFGGFMTAVTRMNIPGVVSAATAGALAGGLVLYALGRRLGGVRVYSLVDRWGRVVRIKRQDVERATGWFERYQGKTVFFCRMIPLVRSMISIPAGMSKMPLVRFTFLTALGSSVWNTVLVCAGAYLGERWDQVLGFFDLYSTATLVLLGGSLLLLTAFLLFRRQPD